MVTQETLVDIQLKLARRIYRFHQASRYLAELNAGSHSDNEVIQERARQNFVRRQESLAIAQQELRALLSTSTTSLVSEANQESEGQNILVNEAGNELLRFLATNPNYLHNLHSRTFEHLIARIFLGLGYSVELMRATHDGGKDLIVRTEGPLGPSLCYVQCKRYSPLEPVGIDVVRQVYGVHMADSVNKSLIVTTSYFTDEAKDFSKRLSFLISLKEYPDVVNWLLHYKGGK